MTGLGGDTFWLIYEKKDGKTRTNNGSGSILEHIEEKRRSLFAG
ncbi:hypothetical protein [Peribacillus sp. CSMR9]|nr:hypothetical protein [Peribacillus sp. CSMR9]MDV7764019.1 hypothetical protein [Peribacillus sp. CSMR9]